jgi:hypothetical protein
METGLVSLRRLLRRRALTTHSIMRTRAEELKEDLSPGNNRALIGLAILGLVLICVGISLLWLHPSPQNGAASSAANQLEKSTAAETTTGSSKNKSP